MLLDRIDIDAHGPLHHVELGPFAEHLNVITGPQGSGKTAITRFVRDSLVQRDYPQGMLSASCGRIVWADRNGLVHCRREQDGTVDGRRSVEFESRGDTLGHLDGHNQAWIGDVGVSTASSRAIQSLQLPESIVDGVITDTAITSVARVVSACVRAGLDSADSYQSLPLHEKSNYHSRDEYSPLNPNSDEIDQRDYDRNRRLRQQLAEIESELSRLRNYDNSEFDDSRSVRRRMRSLPIIDRRWYDDDSQDSLHNGGFHYPARATQHRMDSLRRRRAQILEQLQVVHRPLRSRSPLADAASGWLVRLSGGRLRQIAWPYRQFRADGRSHHRDSYQPTGVTIDWRDEQHCPAADRAMAVIAVRMAAGDLLARTGRHVPLVLETHRELFDASCSVDHGDAPLAYFDNGDLTRGNSPLASALRDYSRAGRQVVLFTSNQSLAGQLGRVGAHSYQLHARPVVHAHRPLWKSHYEAEQYVGPHPHTYGHRGADEILDRDRHFHDVTSGPIRYRRNPTAPVGDVNRDFDMAWHEAYAIGDIYDRSPNFVASAERTDWSRDGYGLRDGYYVANSFTTNEPVEQACCNHTDSLGIDGQHTCCNQQKTKAIAESTSPFFLSVDSPIDQAPSIDAVASARLRGLKVTHINHLMQQDSNRLADALGLSSVDASTIRRWQAECRLVCRVPQLRGFDARVLVGCGVTTPAQLAAIHPVDLLQQVEAFLASDRGQQILLSGNSHELSRITSWIAAANSSDDDGFAHFGHDRLRPRHSERRNGRQAKRVRRYRNGQGSTANDVDFGFDSDRYEYESDNAAVGRRRSHRKNGRRILRSSNGDVGDRRTGDSTRRRSARGSGAQYAHDDGAHNSKAGRSTGSRSKGGQTGSNARSSRHRNERSGSDSESGSTRRTRNASRRSERHSQDVVRRQRDSRDQEPRERLSYERPERDNDAELKFYLQRESLVVDAPSIGARMAERLNAVGIHTIDDLLNADAETVASELDHRRVDADTVLQWQQQATLVCRVPSLRGHDAQLLVAAEVTTPEELAVSDADELFGIVDTIARSNEGKRIIRGGKLPDLEEVTDWISNGNQHRELMAA